LGKFASERRARWFNSRRKCGRILWFPVFAKFELPLIRLARFKLAKSFHLLPDLFAGFITHPFQRLDNWATGDWNPLLWLDLFSVPEAVSCLTTRVPDSCSRSGFWLFWVPFASHSRHRHTPVTVSIRKPPGTTRSSRRACGVRFVAGMGLLWSLFHIRVYLTGKHACMGYWVVKLIYHSNVHLAVKSATYDALKILWRYLCFMHCLCGFIFVK